MNPFRQSLFTAPSCLPCCTTAPGECACALLIPPFGSPYADYATAETAISDFVADCVGYAIGTGAAPLDSFSVDTSVENVVTLDGNLTATGATIEMYVNISVDEGETVTIDWNNSFTYDGEEQEPHFQWFAYNCAGDLVDSGEFFTASGTDSFTAPAGGPFTIYMVIDDNIGDNTSTTASVDISSTVLVANPVIAQWDDSGTTRKLWACPKLLLPILTESTGTWYADCAAADTVLTGSGVSNCVGYTPGGPGVATFTATDGGTSLTLANTISPAGAGGTIMWGGINAVGGETLTVTATVGAGTASEEVFIYDDEGNSVEDTGGPTSSPWTSSALPYTGRYTIKAVVTSDSSTTSLSAAITSSGTMSVNTIQARYDLGLPCPATLDCGDSCP